MVVAYISLFISIVCLVILIIYKRMLSTKNIMSKVEKLMNKRITEINRIAYEDTELVKESSKTIRTLLAKADDDMKRYQEATQRLRVLLAQIESGNIIPISQENEKDVRVSLKSEKKDSPVPDSKVSYGNLFTQKPRVITEKSDFKPASSNYINVTTKKKNNFTEEVKRMYQIGYSVEEIADQVGCSITEVQYVLDLGL